MSGYSDLTVYENDEERNAVCAELARMLRIVPLTAAAGDQLHPSIVEHARWRNPSPTITAPPVDLRRHDILSERNREAYVAQSAATRDGKVAPLPDTRAASPGSVPPTPTP